MSEHTNVINSENKNESIEETTVATAEDKLTLNDVRDKILHMKKADLIGTACLDLIVGMGTELEQNDVIDAIVLRARSLNLQGITKTKIRDRIKAYAKTKSNWRRGILHQ